MYWARTGTLASRFVLGEAVIVRLPSGEMFVLNESASALWAGIDGKSTTAELAGSLGELYGTDVPESDVEGLLADLQEAGLVHCVEVAQPAVVEPWDAGTVGVYARPAIKARERLETLAGGCGSGYDPPTFPNCQTVTPPPICTNQMF